jgi:hypothetical protein
MAPLPSRRLLIGFETGRPIGCPARRSCERYVPRIAEVTASLRISVGAVASQGGGDTDVERKADRCCHLRSCPIKTPSQLHAIMKASPQTHSQQATEKVVMRRCRRIHGCTVGCEAVSTNFWPAVIDFQQLPLQGRRAQSLTRREVQWPHIAQRTELITRNKCKD